MMRHNLSLPALGRSSIYTVCHHATAHGATQDDTIATQTRQWLALLYSALSPPVALLLAILAAVVAGRQVQR